MTAGKPELVEVGPRDGLQGLASFVPTARKIAMIEELFAAGLRRIEIGSFASPRAVPQMADAAEILRAAMAIEGLVPQVLVPSGKYGDMALEAGADFLVPVVSVSESHSLANVRRRPADAVAELVRVVEGAGPQIRFRFNIATAFDCPFEGRIPAAAVLALLAELVPLRDDLEICLCDTTGRASPDAVEALFTRAAAAFPQVTSWAVHTHDIYGLGVTNVFAAWNAGVRVIDAAVAGLGGCPFAPGATGNVATEDVVWMLEQMGQPTGVDLERLVAVADLAAALDGAIPGGRVRDAMHSRVSCPA